MAMLEPAILDYRKLNAERVEEKRVQKLSAVSDTTNAVGDVSIVVSQTNSEHSWPELVDLLVGKPPSNPLPELLNYVPVHDNTDVIGDAPVLARTALAQISSENVGRGDRLKEKINRELIFVMANFLIKLLSAAFDQLSSVHKPRYALIAMLMSFVSSIVCIFELAYKAGQERVVWRWESKLPWFYYSSPSNKRFGSFPEIIGLICAILQSISSAIIYTFYLQHADYPIKISFWPIVFALGLLCSKFMRNSDQKNAVRKD